MNRTARWATSAWRQYRAVVAWKQDVIAILRKVEEPLRKGRSGSKFLHSLDQTLALLQGQPREPLRLGKAAGKLARSDRPRRPERGEVCPGRCLHLDLELAEDEGPEMEEAECREPSKQQCADPVGAVFAANQNGIAVEDGAEHGSYRAEAEWRDYIPNSVFIVTEALTPKCGPSCFNPWKDFVIPGHTDYFRYRRMAQFNLPTEQRTLLFNFHGRHPGLNDLYKNNFVRGNIIRVFDGLEGVSVGGFTDDYFERMGASHFCLVPMGTSSWTNHLYEAFFAGCIPVILSDGFQVPFEHFLDWPSFSIKWPMTDVSIDLYNFLRSTPMYLIRQMKAAVDAHACWFDWHETLKSDGACSPYLGILKELERKRVAFPKSASRAKTFWRRPAET
eukprot:symbB.v1.2.030419.t1/scaffold3427.1/size57037/1